MPPVMTARVKGANAQNSAAPYIGAVYVLNKPSLVTLFIFIEKKCIVKQNPSVHRTGKASICNSACPYRHSFSLGDGQSVPCAVQYSAQYFIQSPRWYFSMLLIFMQNYLERPIQVLKTFLLKIRTSDTVGTEALYGAPLLGLTAKGCLDLRHLLTCRTLLLELRAHMYRNN